MTVLRLSSPIFDGPRRVSELRLAPAPANGVDVMIDGEALLRRIAAVGEISLAAARQLPAADLIAAALALTAAATPASRSRKP